MQSNKKDNSKIYLTITLNSITYHYPFSPHDKILTVLNHFLPFYGFRVCTSAVIDHHAVVLLSNPSLGYPSNLLIHQCQLQDECHIASSSLLWISHYRLVQMKTEIQSWYSPPSSPWTCCRSTLCNYCTNQSSYVTLYSNYCFQ